MGSTSKIQQNPSWQMLRTILMRYEKIWKGWWASPNAFSPVAESAETAKIGSSLSSLQVVDELRHRSCCLSVWCWTRQAAAHGQHMEHGSSPLDDANSVENTWRTFLPYGYGSIPIDTFLVGWTSIYQLFLCSLGTRVLTHSHILP